MYIKMRKMLILTVILALLTIPAAAAESKPSLGDQFSGLWQTAREKAPEIADKAGEMYQSAKEKAPEVWDAAKDKGSELYQSAKEKAPVVIDKAKDGLHNAQDAISSWNQDQQDQFWQWTESMQSGGSQQTPPEANPSQPDVAPDDPQPSVDVQEVIPGNEDYPVGPKDDPLDQSPLASESTPTSQTAQAGVIIHGDNNRVHQPAADGNVIINGDNNRVVVGNEQSDADDSRSEMTEPDADSDSGLLGKFWSWIVADFKLRTAIFCYMLPFVIIMIPLSGLIKRARDRRNK